MREHHRRLLATLTASEIGGALGLQITYFLVPLTAVQLFEAGPLAIGALNLADSVAALAVGIVLGRWIDRAGSVRAMTAANLLRFTVLALLGLSLSTAPQMWLLYVAMLCIGVASIAHDAGLTAAVLHLEVRSDHGLNRINAVLRTASTLSELAGPGVGGLLVTSLGFATGAGLGSLTFGVAAFAGVLFLRRRSDRARDAVLEDQAPPQPQPLPKRTNGPMSGVRFIWSDVVLRRLSMSSLQFNLFSAVFQAVFLIYCVRELEFDAAAIAVVAVSAGGGALLGAVAAASAAVAASPKAFYCCALALPAFCVAALIFADRVEDAAALVIVAGSQALFSLCMVVCIVLFNTIRQVKSPGHMAGQIAAAERVLALIGEIPGAVLGGILGTVFLLALPLAVASVGMLSACLWVLAVPDWSSKASTDRTETQRPSVN